MQPSTLTRPILRAALIFISPAAVAAVLAARLIRQLMVSLTGLRTTLFLLALMLLHRSVDRGKAADSDPETGGQSVNPTARPQERNNTVEYLQSNPNLFQAILDTLDALVVILDRHERVVLFNRACEQTTGYSFEEVRGQPVWELLIPPHEVPVVRQAFDRLLCGEQIVSLEGSWLTRDGSARVIAWSSTILRDTHGEVQYFISTGIDITDRKQVEEELRASEERFRALVQHSSDLITIIEADGTIRYQSPSIQQILGFSPPRAYRQERSQLGASA